MLSEIKNHLLLFGLLLAGVIISAITSNSLIQTELKLLPHYDSVGHFLTFGTITLLAHLVFKRGRSNVFGRNVPIGPTLALVLAFVYESLQAFFITKAFEITDLFWGVMGVIVFGGISRIVRKLDSTQLKLYTSELLHFTFKELRAVIFAGSFLFLLFVSNYIPLGPIPRYDFLFIAAILIQVLLIAFKLETKDEAKTIFLFHLIGLCLELFKTHPSVGSWSYPEAGYLRVLGVPLYSGFMYAAVGSYIAQAWKILRMRLVNHPPYWLSLVLCFFIYLNFFTNHFIYDYRMFLYVAILVIYYKTDIHFTPKNTEHKMPLIVGFVLTGFFVWIAENIATFYGAWKYPGQIHVWEVVSLQKITSWFLLVIICFIVVAYLKHFKEERVKA